MSLLLLISNSWSATLQRIPLSIRRVDNFSSHLKILTTYIIIFMCYKLILLRAAYKRRFCISFYNVNSSITKDNNPEIKFYYRAIISLTFASQEVVYIIHTWNKIHVAFYCTHSILSIWIKFFFSFRPIISFPGCSCVTFIRKCSIDSCL